MDITQLYDHTRSAVPFMYSGRIISTLLRQDIHVFDEHYYIHHPEIRDQANQADTPIPAMWLLDTHE
jgi:hypothetical protein